MNAETYTEVVDALRAMGLCEADETPALVALTGGVSSDIWRADLRARPVCVKRALPQLRVAAEWKVPIERWKYEYRWLSEVQGIAPSNVPALYGADEQRRMFAMGFLAPDLHPVWKGELRQGRVDIAAAEQVASVLVRIHDATALRESVAAGFPTDSIFDAIRVDPYLIASGRSHPDLAAHMDDLRSMLFANKRVLVHGDVSPKNILLGPRGPVLLDAECAWYGDPCFDLAFLLNHFLLKCLWTPEASRQFLQCFDAISRTYLAGVTWEGADALETRAARLLPGLFLARVDGKSPVEYVTDEASKDRVRRVSRGLMQRHDLGLGDIRAAWAKELGVD